MPDDPATPSAVRVATRPAGPGSGSRRQTRGEESIRELVAGTALVLITAVGGMYFAIRPASGTVDGWMLDLVGASKAPVFTHVAAVRYPAVIIVVAVIAAAICLPQDRTRALACLVGPPLALVACELVAKPMVGRTLGGSLCYPSGSTVGAAALAAAAVLATPARWRPWTIIVGSAYALWVATAVVALRWHYPTDALAGLAFGAGVVLLVDGAAWQLVRHLGHRWARA
jgi:membrane-associated phospholipid phosphatase